MLVRAFMIPSRMLKAVTGVAAASIGAGTFLLYRYGWVPSRANLEAAVKAGGASSGHFSATIPEEVGASLWTNLRLVSQLRTQALQTKESSPGGIPAPGATVLPPAFFDMTKNAGVAADTPPPCVGVRVLTDTYGARRGVLYVVAPDGDSSSASVGVVCVFDDGSDWETVWRAFVRQDTAPLKAEVYGTAASVRADFAVLNTPIAKTVLDTIQEAKRAFPGYSVTCSLCGASMGAGFATLNALAVGNAAVSGSGSGSEPTTRVVLLTEGAPKVLGYDAALLVHKLATMATTVPRRELWQDGEIRIRRTSPLLCTANAADARDPVPFMGSLYAHRDPVVVGAGSQDDDVAEMTFGDFVARVAAPWTRSKDYAALWGGPWIQYVARHYQTAWQLPSQLTPDEQRRPPLKPQ